MCINLVSPQNYFVQINFKKSLKFFSVFTLQLTRKDRNVHKCRAQAQLIYRKNALFSIKLYGCNTRVWFKIKNHSDGISRAASNYYLILTITSSFWVPCSLLSLNSERSCNMKHVAWMQYFSSSDFYKSFAWLPQTSRNFFCSATIELGHSTEANSSSSFICCEFIYRKTLKFVQPRILLHAIACCCCCNIYIPSLMQKKLTLL